MEARPMMYGVGGDVLYSLGAGAMLGAIVTVIAAVGYLRKARRDRNSWRDAARRMTDQVSAEIRVRDEWMERAGKFQEDRDAARIEVERLAGYLDEAAKRVEEMLRIEREHLDTIAQQKVQIEAHRSEVCRYRNEAQDIILKASDEARARILEMRRDRDAARAAFVHRETLLGAKDSRIEQLTADLEFIKKESRKWELQALDRLKQTEQLTADLAQVEKERDALKLALGGRDEVVEGLRRELQRGNGLRVTSDDHK